MDLEKYRNNPKLKRVGAFMDKLPAPDRGFSMPGFWKRRGAWQSILRELLMPASVLYYMGFLWDRSRTRVERLSCPVWCVGNITVGGAGKTPFALLLAETLKGLGQNPAFISRGFGGLVRAEMVKVDPAAHTSLEVGDEPLLLARTAPCYVAEKRVLAGQAAINEGAGMLIMDDGLQHHGLHKDVSFLVIDGAFGFGNGGIIPAGPLREPPHQVIARVSAVVLVGEDKNEVLKKFPQAEGQPLIRVDVVAEEAWLKEHEYLKDKKLLAFAGIAMPEKFYDTLRRAGFLMSSVSSYPDHHAYSAADLETLKKLAREQEAVLITTEKDWVRLPEAMKAEVLALPVKMVPKDPEAFSATIRSFL